MENKYSYTHENNVFGNFTVTTCIQHQCQSKKIAGQNVGPITLSECEPPPYPVALLSHYLRISLFNLSIPVHIRLIKQEVECLVQASNTCIYIKPHQGNRTMNYIRKHYIILKSDQQILSHSVSITPFSYPSIMAFLFHRLIRNAVSCCEYKLTGLLMYQTSRFTIYPIYIKHHGPESRNHHWISLSISNDNHQATNMHVQIVSVS